MWWGGRWKDGLILVLAEQPRGEGSIFRLNQGLFSTPASRDSDMLRPVPPEGNLQSENQH